MLNTAGGDCDREQDSGTANQGGAGKGFGAGSGQGLAVIAGYGGQALLVLHHGLVVLFLLLQLASQAISLA